VVKYGQKITDKGAVCFKIPLIKLNETEKEIPLLQAKFLLNTKIKILVAEDDSISLKFISRF
jgi:hypothetical protein